MDRNEALKLMATHGYNVGYGAKKHFATYDIIEKVPGLISFISITFGILSLKYFSQELEGHVAVMLTVFGVVSLYISFYLNNKDKYEVIGSEITKIFAQLQTIYLTLKDNNSNINDELEKANILMDDFYKKSISKQILFSDWYAHYKFFIQTQIDWIDEQKSFSFFKDKIPRSFQFCVLLALVYFSCVLISDITLVDIRNFLN